jgi:hypothetical protein
MKPIIIIITCILLYSGNKQNPAIDNPASKHEKKAEGIEFIATPIGHYFNRDNEKDSNRYFLVEVKLINNTETKLEFFTMSCSSLVNIVIDSKEITTLNHVCASNYPIFIRLEPKQEYALPIILIKKGKNLQTPSVKFGFILNQPKYRFGKLIIQKDPIQEIGEMREKLENIVWSHPINLNPVFYNHYQIRNIISDSTYSISKRRY